ncbi:MAG: Bro-N domain-containing protein [Nitrospirae bacterium]|nr:Bro-N domain-containing protein [Nitrospirota bacterium]
MTETHLAVFKGRKIRKTIHNNEWWFVINDVIESLTDSNDPAQYFKRLKQRDEELAKLTDKGGVQFVPPLMIDIETTGGKQKMYCWNTEGIFRLIQSIPSPKAEPFKRWLAKVGYERVQEIEDPLCLSSINPSPVLPLVEFIAVKIYKVLYLPDGFFRAEPLDREADLFARTACPVSGHPDHQPDLS